MFPNFGFTLHVEPPELAAAVQSQTPGLISIDFPNATFLSTITGGEKFHCRLPQSSALFAGEQFAKRQPTPDALWGIDECETALLSVHDICLGIQINLARILDQCRGEKGSRLTLPVSGPGIREGAVAWKGGTTWHLLKTGGAGDGLVKSFSAARTGESATTLQVHFSDEVTAALHRDIPIYVFRKNPQRQ